MSAKFCSNCGAKLEDDSTFCGECGAKLAAETDAAAGADEAEKKAQDKGKGFFAKSKKYLSILAVIIAVFAVMGIKHGGSVIEVKPVEMADDYIRDQASAEKKYKDHTVHITAPILEKGQFVNSGDFMLIVSNKYEGGKRYTIMVSVPKAKASAVNKLHAGDYLDLEGDCIGIVKQDDPTHITVQINGDNIKE